MAQRLWRDRRGAALIEYALLIGLVTLTVLGAVVATGSWAHGMWGNFLPTWALNHLTKLGSQASTTSFARRWGRLSPSVPAPADMVGSVEK